jgi:hypothetical protein
MKITISEIETSNGFAVYLDGNSIGDACYNFEAELALKPHVALTADQMIAVGNRLKESPQG